MEVTYRIECSYEFAAIEGNAMASGDPEYDRQIEEDIREQLANGNEWAWGTVTVIAELGDFSGSNSLGCCSYANEEDFKNGGYFEDMKEQALEDLTRNIQEKHKEATEALKILENN